MAKKATARAKSARGDKPKKARPPAGRSSKRTASGPGQAGSRGPSAAEALVKLIESPLVAELLAVGATAALAAIAAEGFGRRSEGNRPTRALKAAGKAAAAAMGKRLGTEIDEIRKAADKARMPRAAEAG